MLSGRMECKLKGAVGAWKGGNRKGTGGAVIAEAARGGLQDVVWRCGLGQSTFYSLATLCFVEQRLSIGAGSPLGTPSGTGGGRAAVRSGILARCSVEPSTPPGGSQRKSSVPAALGEVSGG